MSCHSTLRYPVAARVPCVFAAALLLVGASFAARGQQPAVDYPKAKGAFDNPHKGSRPNGQKIDRAVVHSTFDKSVARDKFFEAATILKIWKDNGVSTHYFIGRDGTIWQVVPEAEEALHDPRYNNRAVGIELAGIADEFADEAKQKGATADDLAYTAKQYAALNDLIGHLAGRYAGLRAIRHSEIYTQQLTVVPTEANVRKEPKSSAPVEWKVPTSTKLWTFASKDGFYRVTSGEKKGWIAAQDVTMAWKQRKTDPGEGFDESKVAGVTFVKDHGQ